MTVGSLFAGIGGFDLAATRVGWNVRWQVEINPFCRRVLEQHWPGVRRYEDVRTVDGRELERVDVVCGGFPCKQTSVAAAIHGRRVGLAGRDSGLWRDMWRLLGELRPRFAVVENPESPALDQVQGCLEGLGYAVSRHPFTAKGFGAPHLRRRVFLVADRDGAGLAQRGTTGASEVAGESWPPAERNPWLSALPGVLRVDDGVPGGLDRRERITAIGNAVVPAAAEWIFRVIDQRRRERTA